VTAAPLRIAAFARILPLHGPGGMQAVTQDITRGLAAAGHDVELFSTEAPGQQGARTFEEAAGLLIHLLMTGSPGRYSVGWRRAADEAFRRRHADRPFDVILSFSAAIRGINLRWRRTGLAVPTAVAIFGTHVDELRAALQSMRGDLTWRGATEGLARAADAVYRAARDARFMRSPDRIVASCPGDAEKVQRTFRISAARMSIIPYGVDAGLRMRLRRVVRPGGLVAVVVARLERDKGIQVALRALAEVRGRIPGIRLRIVGDGSYRAGLEQLAERLGVREICEFAGSVPYDSLEAAFTGASLVLNPRLRPTAYDQALVVAMATGLPVILSDLGDVRFVAHPGRDSLFVPPADPGALAQAIAQCLSDRGLAARLGGAAAATIESRFTLEQTIQSYSDLLRSLC